MTRDETGHRALHVPGGAVLGHQHPHPKPLQRVDCRLCARSITLRIRVSGSPAQQLFFDLPDDRAQRDTQQGQDHNPRKQALQIVQRSGF